MENCNVRNTQRSIVPMSTVGVHVKPLSFALRLLSMNKPSKRLTNIGAHIVDGDLNNSLSTMLSHYSEAVAISQRI